MANEKRLIDANALMEAARNSTASKTVKHAICIFAEIAPIVDAVEVVRCKDCKSWEQYNACDGTKPHRCMNHDAIFYKRTAPNDFCSYGERKDNGNA